MTRFRDTGCPKGNNLFEKRKKRQVTLKIILEPNSNTALFPLCWPNDKSNNNRPHNTWFHEFSLLDVEMCVAS